ncbi:MAG: porin family protein [Ferruginibacter sp.]|nr:porin family protein [Ferruginibacter sp.]
MKAFIIKKLLFIVAISLVATTCLAQQFNLALNYNTATPLGKTFKEYVNNTSFRGIQGSVLYTLNNDFRIGLQASYNDFYQKYGRQVYKTTDGADISAVLSNTLQEIPVLVKAEYTLVKDGWIKPYIGLGAGVNFINFDQFFGEFKSSRFYTKAAFSGDLGVLIPFHKTGEYGVRLSTSYNLSPFDKEGIKNISTWNGQLGIVVPLK